MHNQEVGNLDERMDTEPVDSSPVPRDPEPREPEPRASLEPAGPETATEPVERGEFDLDDLDFVDLAVLTDPDGDATAPAPVLPPVVAVVVTDGGVGLETTLVSLADQEYPSLSTLVIDRGAGEELTARVAEVYPHAYVRRLPGHRSFTEAANVAFGSVEGATFFLVCRDDVVVEPGAVRVLVEEAYRSNAAIVGPKVVDIDRPDVLVEVGLTIDRYGIPFTGIEPGELDQEQHDAVRDVFCVSDALMLLRADLVEELGGFDPRAEPGAADLDLCWRARLIGARVVVAPDARVRRRAGVGGRRRTRVPSTVRDANRSRIHMVAKCTATTALVWVLPVAFALDLGEAAGLVATRRFARAGALLAGWWSALLGLRSTFAARRPLQAKRQVSEHDLHMLMVRGSSRVRTTFAIRLQTRSRLDLVETRTKRAVGSARASVRGAGGIAWTVVLVVILFGSRNLIASGVPSVGGFAVWPRLGALLSTYHSSWRNSGLGSASPASAAFGFMSVASGILFGHTALARTLVVVGAVPLGGLGVYRALRPTSASPLPAIAGLVAYVANPLPRNLLGAGQLGPLVLYALAPFIVSGLADAVGDVWTVPDPVRQWKWRRVAGVGALTAIVTAFWPPALFLALLVGAVTIVGAPLLGDLRSATRVAAAAFVSTGAALVLLVPWPLALLHADGPSLGLLPRAPLSLSDVLRFHTGSSGAGLLPWGLLVAAALPLITATGNRLVWAGRAWLLVAASFTLAWLPGRLSPSLPVPVAGGLLVPAALGLAVAVGLGVAAFVEELRTVVFGWRQVAAVVAALGLLAPVPGVLGDALGGSWRLPGADWQQSLSWMNQSDGKGAFRVLWIGSPSVLPLDGAVSDGLGYGLSRNGAPDARSLWPAPGGTAGTVVHDAVGLLATAGTARLGHVLAPLGVRYVAVIDRAAPGASGTRTLPPGLSTTLAGQLDLSVRQAEPGLTLYENAAWIPAKAIVSRPLPVGGSPTEQALTSDLSTDAKPYTGGATAGPGSLFVSEAHDSRWHASQSGHALPDVAAFGWANGYRLSASAPVRVHFAGGPQRALALLVQALAWLALGALLIAGPLRRLRRRRSDPVDLGAESKPAELDRPSLVGATSLAVGRS
jgi:GT2 family glycosyltransferase